MNTHGIQRVARLTVLSKDVIRVWERRYGIVQPVRSATRYRTYTDEDVALPRDISRHHVTNQVRQKLSSAMSHLPFMRKA
jgi:DNA-binding transcriptional MerR regulator